MVINALIFKEIISKRAWGGAVLAFLGVYIVMVGPSLSIFGASTIIGDLLGVAIGAIWAIYTSLGKKVVSKFDPLATTALLFTLCLAVTGSFWVVEGSISKLAELTVSEWVMLAYVGICCEGIGFWLWYNACAAIPSEKVALFIYVSPLTAIILGIFWLGEAFTWATAVGFILTIIGLYVAETGGSRDSKEKKELITTGQT